MNIVQACAIFVLVYIQYLFTSIVALFVPDRMKRKNIAGKRVLITGAGSGLGRHLAIEFSKYSTCLILVDINRKALLQTEKLLDRRSACFIYDCDVSDYKKVYAMAERVKREAGDVEILVNNAGIVSGMELLDLPEEKIIKTMEVNALAHFWTCKAFLPAMMDKNEGHIVTIASIAGKTAVGGARITDYCASKFAAVGFAESLETEIKLKKLDGITVTVICPSVMDTDLFKGVKFTIGGRMSPEYVAKEVVAAVLRDDETVIIPHFLKYILFLRFLPRRFLFKILDMTGDSNFMKNFIGRTQNENSNNEPETK